MMQKGSGTQELSHHLGMMWWCNYIAAKEQSDLVIAVVAVYIVQKIVGQLLGPNATVLVLLKCPLKALYQNWATRDTREVVLLGLLSGTDHV